VWFLWLVGLTALVGSAIAVAVMSHRYRERWGTRPGPPLRTGDSPYREAETRGEVLRGVPSVVRWAAASGIGWGILTLLIFMPGGFLLVALIADAFGPHHASWVSLLSLLLVSIHAIPVAFALMVAARAVMRGDEEGRRTARGIASWSSGHHFAVILALMLVTIVEPDLFAVLLLALVPCFLGLGHALLLRQAADTPGNGAEQASV